MSTINQIKIKKEKIMKLQEYINWTGLSIRKFASKCSIEPSVVYKAVQENHRIDVTTALMIEKATNSEVKAIELCSPEFQEKYEKFESAFKRRLESESLKKKDKGRLQQEKKRCK